MKRLLVILLLNVAAVAQTYTTTFPLTELPVSEGAKWTNGSVTGTWKDCRSQGNVYAYGTQSASTVYDDSTCLLTGQWGLDQTVQTKIHIVHSPRAQFEEAEIRLRSNLDPVAHTATGYEINCSVVPSQRYMQIVRWNGPLGSFTNLNGYNGYCKEGDILQASIVGNLITVKLNGTTRFSWTDRTFDATHYCNNHPCNPGMGFYIQNASSSIANSDFGISQFTAVANGGGGVPTAPVVTPATVTLYSLATQQFAVDQQVTWSATSGRITTAGLFTAPDVTQATQITITATNANGTGTATVAVNPVGTCQYAPASAPIQPQRPFAFLGRY